MWVEILYRDGTMRVLRVCEACGEGIYYPLFRATRNIRSAWHVTPAYAHAKLCRYCHTIHICRKFRALQPRRCELCLMPVND